MAFMLTERVIVQFFTWGEYRNWTNILHITTWFSSRWHRPLPLRSPASPTHPAVFLSAPRIHTHHLINCERGTKPEHELFFIKMAEPVTPVCLRLFWKYRFHHLPARLCCVVVNYIAVGEQSDVSVLFFCECPTMREYYCMCARGELSLDVHLSNLTVLLIRDRSFILILSVPPTPFITDVTRVT